MLLIAGGVIRGGGHSEKLLKGQYVEKKETACWGRASQHTLSPSVDIKRFLPFNLQGQTGCVLTFLPPPPSIRTAAPTLV